MRLVAAAATIFVLLATPASTQRGNPTPSQGDESAKLAASYDPTKATVITASDIQAAIGRLPNQNSANATFVEHNDPSSITGLAYRIAVDRRRVPQNANAHSTEAEIWAVVDGAGVITLSAPSTLHISATANVVFTNLGAASPAGTYVVTNPANNGSRSVVVAATGRISVR